MFGSILDYKKKTELLLLLNKTNADLLTESGLLKKDNDSFYKDFEKKLLEQNEECLDYIKNEE